MTMNNGVVIVDICNTLANVNDQLAMRGYKTDSYPSILPCNIWDDERIFTEAAPIEPVIYFVRRLAEVAEIVYMTARPKELQRVTMEWLRKHCAPEAPIVFTEGQLKGNVIQSMVGHESRSPIVFEDSPHEIKSIVSVMPGINLFIPDWLYNRHLAGNRISF